MLVCSLSTGEGLLRILDLMLHLEIPGVCITRGGGGRRRRGREEGQVWREGRQGTCEIYILICREGSVKYITPNVIPGVTWLV